jgi:hypothetical protein
MMMTMMICLDRLQQNLYQFEELGVKRKKVQKNLNHPDGEITFKFKSMWISRLTQGRQKFKCQLNKYSKSTQDQRK